MKTMNMYEAIFIRKSVKKFVMEELDSKLLEQIEQFATELPLAMENANVEFKIFSNLHEEKQISKILSVKSPYYFVVGCDHEYDQLINAGFLMEQITLYLASRGLGSTWLTHTHLKADNLDGFEKDPILVIAFGKANQIMFRNHRRVHRLPENEIALYKEDVNADVKLMVKAARLAPSYLNTQPWRLVVYENRIHIFCKKNIFGQEVLQDKKLIDVGVMIANMMLVAEELWIDVKIEKVENISNKYFKNNIYVFSVIVR